MFTPSDPADKPKRPSMLSRKEFRYILIMILVLLLMCFVIATQVFQETPDENKQVTASYEAPVKPFETDTMSDKTGDAGQDNTEISDEPVGPPPPPAPFAHDPNVLNAVDDNKIGDRIETEPFYYCMHMINSMNQSEIKAKAKADKITIENIAGKPEDCRGKFVTFQGGYVLERRCSADDEKNRSGVQVFWEGVVFNARANKFFTVYFIEKPFAYDWNPHAGKKDIVEVHGVFLKRRHFYNRVGKVSRDYIVFARRLEQGTDTKLESTWSSPILWIAGAFVFIIIIVLAFLLRMEAGKSAKSEHAFKARHRKKIDDKFARAKVVNPDAIKKGADKPEPPPAT